ncbi:MAG: hypothetical protein ACRDV4_07620, partial [Acidimicrobiales bacterium]
AEHSQPEVVRALAREIASLADWTQPGSSVAVPQVREQLDRTLASWRAANPDPARPSTPIPAPSTPLPVVPQGAGAPTRAPEPSRDLRQGRNMVLDQDLERLVARLRAAERERVLLRQVVRSLRAAMTPSAFADALANLSQGDREFVDSLLSDRNAADATAVVQVFRRENTPTSRTPTMPRSPRVPGPDVAAS